MKKNTLTKSMALALACAMALAGCGNGGKTPATTPAPESKPAESSAAPAESAPAESEAGGAVSTGKGPGYDYIANLPKLSEEKVSYKLAISQEVNQEDWNQMDFFKALEEATNVHVEFECYPQASYNDQKNLMLASGEYPDGFLGYATLNMADLNQYGPMGIFIPVEDLIAENCPNYTQLLKERPVMDGLSTAFDGHKYSWGTVNEHTNRDFPDNLYINKAWLDKLGLEIPTTMDEYYEVLKAFKEQDPNGNGEADEIPFTFSPFHHIQGYGGFFGAWGRAEMFNGNPKGKIEDHFSVENGKVVFQPITEEYKAAVKGLQRFFTDGLFDKEGFVQDPEQYNAKVTSSTPIVGSMYIWDVTPMTEENQAQYVALKPLKAAADSPEAAVHKRNNHISIQPMGLAITNKCKNPEILAKWVDLFYTDEMTILSYYGPEKVTNIDENGAFTYDESPSEDGAPFTEFVKINAPFDGSPKFLTMDIIDNKMLLQNTSSMKQDTIKEYYVNAPVTESLPTMNYTTEENEFLSSYGLGVVSYVNEMQSKWLLGTGDIDKDWDSYMKQLETLKVNEYIDMMQSVYDRTIGK